MCSTRFAPCFALFLFLMSISPNCNAQAIPQYPTPQGFGLDVKLTSPFLSSPGPITFSNIPQALRTVPSNQYGPLASGTPVTIPVSTFTVQPSSVGFSIGFAPQYTAWRLTLRGGVSLAFMNLTSGPPTAEGGPYEEINQFGTTQRGTGTSLVYYSMYWDRTPPIITPFGELEFRISRFVSFVGGYSGPKTMTVTLENGYDQFDALTVYSTHNFASINMEGSGYGSAKVNVFGPYVAIFAGATPVKWDRLTSPYPVANNFNGANDVQVFIGADIAWMHTRRR